MPRRAPHVTPPTRTHFSWREGLAGSGSDERCFRRFHYRVSAGGMRSATVTANAFRAGFHLMTHRA